jgi:hypothetical protein
MDMIVRSDDMAENKPYDEIQARMTASVCRILTCADIEMFATCPETATRRA